MIEYVKKVLPKTELLAQLAEEATELAHAALKLRRAIDGTNTTPVTYEAALDNLHEEIADVHLVLNILGIESSIEHPGIMAAKLERWVRRLQATRTCSTCAHDAPVEPCHEPTRDCGVCKKPCKCYGCTNYENWEEYHGQQ